MSDFIKRHIGIADEDCVKMLSVIGADSIQTLLKQTLPKSIFSGNKMNLPAGLDEQQVLAQIADIAKQNKRFKTYIGQGYHPTFMPSVIKRNILENPGWYTAYTPYQSEISQGRLEMLINFQQMIIDLTAMEIANASLLDEATAAAEAMMMCWRISGNKTSHFFVDKNVHPQTIAVLTTRSKPLGIELVIDAPHNASFDNVFAALIQYPDTTGDIIDLARISKRLNEVGAMTIAAVDMMAMVLLKPPGECGVDVVIGSTQRFGVPMGFGGPHAAFLATKDKYKRQIPGRVIGVSKDVQGNVAYRMALQTREQHIRRDKANSNICTAQVLLAVLAAAYGIYHGQAGLKRIAERIHHLTARLAKALDNKGVTRVNKTFFDTLTLDLKTAQKAQALCQKAAKQNINLRRVNNTQIGIAINELTTEEDLSALAQLFTAKLSDSSQNGIDRLCQRSSEFLTHPTFCQYHSETEMMRYLTHLENKDIALNRSMIALGSCTMKLNAATQMYSIGFDGFDLHPYVPLNQCKGYQQLMTKLSNALAEITGYDAISLQPNAGSQGEYAGLLAIRHYHASRGEADRDICLIPSSAHGTNPASAVMAGMKVVIVACDNHGNVKLEDLETKLTEHTGKVAAIMITYPSTHGVFEEKVVKLCEMVHQHGGQVYIDGANLNAMVGLAQMGKFGGDVSHLNLHKTFAIPHGGGGPGVGPIGVKKHLEPFLPQSPLLKSSGAVAAAEFGSASILPISWAYIALLGKTGLQQSSETAILSANYIAKCLESDYPVLYKGKQFGRVAHECILDLRPIEKATGISEEDIAKRLIDYGFHAPTMSFPVAGTLMIEPTESESKAEIDRFIEAMRAIRQEIAAIADGQADKANNVLKNAPHTALEMAGEWPYPYTRQQACYPVATLKRDKYFPPVKRIDNVYGDRNLVCACPSVDSYQDV